MSDDRIERDKTLKDMFRKYLRLKSATNKDGKSPTSPATPAAPAAPVTPQQASKSPPPKVLTPLITANSSNSLAARTAPTSEKSCRTEDEDAEVFENEAGSRPAVTKMRAAKIRWKSEEKKSSSKGSSDADEAANRIRRKKRVKTPVTTPEKDSKGKEKPKEPTSDNSKDKEKRKAKAAAEAKTPPKEIKKDKPDKMEKLEKLDREPPSKMETKSPASKMELKTEKEVKEPASKMEKTEPKETKMEPKETKMETKVGKETKEQASKMEKIVPKEKEVKSEMKVEKETKEPASKMELKTEPKVEKETKENRSTMEIIEPKKTVEQVEESPKSEMEFEKKESIDPETMATAASILDCLKRNQLLESALNYQETATMTSFFENSGAAPSAQVVAVMDKAMTLALNMLEFKPGELDVTIDNRMRELLLNRDKAKTILLEVLLSRSSEFLPISWGGKGGDRAVNNNIEPPKTPPAVRTANSKSPAATTPDKK